MTSYTLQVLRLLQDGEFHSGEDLGRALRISRESVSNALDDVEQHGLKLERVRGRGYRLLTPVQWLDATRITAAMGASAERLSLELVDQTASTNDDLLAALARGAGSGLVRVAELQTHGRGRRGRRWHAGLGGALTFSILWRFAQGAGLLSGLSLAVGVALLRVVRRHGVSDAMLKWPNDLLWRHRKLAGILIELAGDVVGPTAAVIGVGLNVRLPRSVIDEIDQPVVDLAQIGVEVDRNVLLGELLAQIEAVLTQFSTQGFAPFAQEWNRAHAYHDKMVRLRMPDNTMQEGRVAGVAPDGALMLAVRSGTRKYYGGELTLRPVKS
ncbi:MAG TPA: biotin--[acetyl-CoA-carboxylase] ligase [Burkholderiales bacterium]|jgi:BirA family biotin operon repressor/biotin-[acetyl-CoA-carboxylase] ligase|nr:biotin--[acetyl-CoA-carboxylase] ligase [Burkholderiales bacterium]